MQEESIWAYFNVPEDKTAQSASPAKNLADLESDIPF